MASLSSNCFQVCSTDTADIWTIERRTHIGLPGAANGRCNGSNRPNKLKTFSPLAHSSMAIFVHVGAGFPNHLSRDPLRGIRYLAAGYLCPTASMICPKSPHWRPDHPLRLNVTMPFGVMPVRREDIDRQRHAVFLYGNMDLDAPDLLPAIDAAVKATRRLAAGSTVDNYSTRFRSISTRAPPRAAQPVEQPAPKAEPGPAGE